MDKRFKVKPDNMPGDSKYALITKDFGAYDTLIYFVNCSNTVIRSVTSSTGGFITLDDSVASLEGKSTPYKRVLPGEAVLVDKFNIVYDSDGLKQLSIEIQEENTLPYELRYIFKKAPQNMTLMDKQGKCHKSIQMFEVKDTDE